MTRPWIEGIAAFVRQRPEDEGRDALLARPVEGDGDGDSR